MDDPTATPSRAAPGTSSAPHGDDSDGEDEAPDYLRLMSTLNSKSKSSNASSSGGIVIPKRGEKDFEPTGFGGQAKLLERSREAMFQAVSGERRVGSRSLVRAVWDPKTCRARLVDVQGKIFETVGVIRREQVAEQEPVEMNTPEWNERVLEEALFGKATGRTRTWNELLPEEALFLAERGSLQILEQTTDRLRETVELSLQQAFAALMQPPSDGTKGEDEPITREAYLIYAYLKRLGYVVQRASIVDAVRAAPISASALAKKNGSQAEPFALISGKKAEDEGIIADPDRPIKLVTIWDIFLYIPRRIVQLAGDGINALARWLHRLWQNTTAKVIASIAAASRKVFGGRVGSRGSVGSLGLGLGLGNGQQDGRRFLGEKGAVKWDSYDAVFSSLQIVPSGHDFWLPSDSKPPARTPTALPAAPSATVQQTIGGESRPSNDHLKPFYYAWRPATLYRKSHPPPPEFRIVILNARTTPVPSVWQFESIFAQIPIPGSDQELFGAASVASTSDGTISEAGGMSEQAIRDRLEYEKKLKASNEAKNRAAYGKFSDGKQKFLREKAAARQAAWSARQQTKQTAGGVMSRISNTTAGRAVIKVLLLDFAVLRTVGRLFSHCPGCWTDKGRHGNRGGAGGKLKGRNPGAGSGRGGTGNPFPPLKAGRRTVVVAVVDGSITTLLRFGESEFANWALYGTQPQPESQQQIGKADDQQQSEAAAQSK
uniref:tRNA-splicing endonuclease subunit Sen54 N-terminal domain-containing protein n=2 Tax=Kalmanozyma brasiliensis (strain GHG001) TaxID=1365824 RepID=V5F082_KALBG